jgi:predicted metal-dependent phosphoesterase TrpH
VQNAYIGRVWILTILLYPERVRIDLHTHSTASDGTQSPAALVASAAAAGLDVIALTDHDSTAGWAEALEASERCNVEVVPGVELSCRLDGISVHLLGYLVDPAHPVLAAELAATREDRVRRARQMVARMAADYRLTWDDVLAHVPDGATVGRPHLADALIAGGYVADRDEAFATILNAGSRYHVAHRAPQAADAVQTVLAAGGVAVMAHPLAAGRGAVVTDDAIARLARAGLTGLEADHPDHLPAERDHLRGLARDLGLLVTGASDYHGSGRPHRLGACLTDQQTYEALLSGARGRPV